MTTFAPNIRKPLAQREVLRPSFGQQTARAGQTAGRVLGTAVALPILAPALIVVALANGMAALDASREDARAA